MFFDPLNQGNFLITGSWELVDEMMNFSLLIDNSKLSWANMLLTIRESNEFCSKIDLMIDMYAQPYDEQDGQVKKVGEQFNICHAPSNSVLETHDYEIALKIPPSSFTAGAYFVYPIISANYEGEDLGIVYTGKKVVVQVLDLTY